MAKQRKAKEIPIREALEIIGTSLFAELWTDKELNQSYFDLFRSCRGQLHNPQVKEFLRSDLNDPKIIRHLKSSIKDQDFFSRDSTKKKTSTNLSPVAGKQRIANWDKKLTTISMKGTYRRFWEAWEILLTSLEDGVIKSYEMSDSEGMKEIPRTKWRSQEFDYDLFTSNIFTKTGYDDADYVISRCYVLTEDIESALQECFDKEDIGAGRPSLNRLLLWRYNIRRKQGIPMKDVKSEAKEIREWAVKLVPTIGRIENLIRDSMKQIPDGDLKPRK